MAVLKLDPTKAPDFSSTSKILAQAGLSMERGFEAAQGLLGSYQEGAQERVDNEVFAETAGMNREQLQAFFDKNGLKGRNLSVAGRERLGKRFADIANINQVRQQTASGLSATKRLEAVERDRAANEVDRLRAQKIAREQGPDAAAAWLEAQREGRSGPGAAPVRPGAPGAAGPIAAAAAGQPGPSAAVAPVSAATPPAPTPATTGQRPNPAPAGGTEAGFMGAVGETVKNPFALAAIAATGKHESAFDAKNATSEWQDGANKAGGIMSWNGPRLEAMKKFTKGDMSPEAQAAFFLQEDPALMAALEQTTSVEEAVALMNNAWRFKGYDQPGGEAESRLETARAIHGGGTAPIQTSPLDAPRAPSSAVVDPIAAAVAAGPGPGGYSLREPGSENVANLFASNLPSLTDPSKTSGGVLPTGPTGAAPAPEDSVAPPSTGQFQGAAQEFPVITMEELQQEFAQKGMKGTPAEIAIDAAVRPPEVTELVNNPRAARDARIAQIMANPTLTGDQMIAKLSSLSDATDQGEAKNLKAEAVKRQENLTRIATEWADDPESDMKLETLQKLLASQPGTAMEKLNAGLYALEVGNGALAYRIKPDYIKDPAVQRGVADELARNRKSLEIQTIHRIANNAKLFGDDDPTTGLEALVKSSNDGKAQTPYFWGFAGADATAANSLRKLVNFIAEEAGVTPAMAAAAMADRFTADPAGFNTNENRFDKRGTIDWLIANANEEALRVYEGDVERVARREDELNTGGVTLSVMQHRLKKMNDTNSTPQERKDAKQAITSLQNTLKAGRTPVEGAEALSDYIGVDGMGIQAYLKTLEPGGAAHKKATAFIKLSINGDTEISSAHKRLLLAAINS